MRSMSWQDFVSSVGAVRDSFRQLPLTPYQPICIIHGQQEDAHLTYECAKCHQPTGSVCSMEMISPINSSCSISLRSSIL